MTGGIGAGKSSFCRLVAGCGRACVIDADEQVHRILRENPDVKAAVTARFGPAVTDARGEIDRARLAAVVFEDPAQRRILEGIVHPLVQAALARHVAALKQNPATDIVLVEIPLLAEVGRPAWCDRVICIEAPREVRLERLVRKGMPREDAMRRISQQADDAQRRECATEVIENRGDLAALTRVARELWERWRRD